MDADMLWVDTKVFIRDVCFRIIKYAILTSLFSAMLLWVMMPE